MTVLVSTAVTKENLITLEKKFKTDNNECVEREWKLIFNEFVKCTMTYMYLGYDLKNFLTWKKKALNAHCFCFVLVDLKTDRSTWSSIAQKARVSFVAYICMCQRYLLQNRRVWDGVKHRNEKEHSSSWNPLGEKTN